MCAFAREFTGLGHGDEIAGLYIYITVENLYRIVASECGSRS